MAAKSTFSFRSSDMTGGGALPPDILDRIGRSLKFVEQNLSAGITVEAMAERACISLFHFCRVFNKIVRHSPYEYVVRRRLSESAAMLLERRLSVTETAFSSGFQSSEGFARAFERMFGLLPSILRRMDAIDRRFLFPPVDGRYLTDIHSAGLYRPAVIELTPIRLYGTAESVPEFADIPAAMDRHRTCERIVIDFGTDWGEAGMTLFFGGRKRRGRPDKLETGIKAGKYTAFHDIGPNDGIASFLHYYHATYRVKTGRHSLPDRIVFSTGPSGKIAAFIADPPAKL